MYASLGEMVELLVVTWRFGGHVTTVHLNSAGLVKRMLILSFLIVYFQLAFLKAINLQKTFLWLLVET